MKKQRTVTICTGGGGPAEQVLQSECVLTDKVKFYCHPELDSGSVQRCELSVTPVRFRNGLARLAKNGTAKSVVFA